MSYPSSSAQNLDLERSGGFGAATGKAQNLAASKSSKFTKMPSGWPGFLSGFRRRRRDTERFTDRGRLRRGICLQQGCRPICRLQYQAFLFRSPYDGVAAL